MGDFSFPELLVLVVIAILIYGKDLPQAARKLAHLYARLKRQLSDVRDELQRQIPAEELRIDVDAAPRGATEPPSAPAAAAATPGAGKVSVTWTPSPGAASYTLRRCAGDGEPWFVVAGTLSDNSYTDLDIAPGKTYRYTVSASNEAGESGESPEAVAAMARPAEAAPDGAAPAGS